MDKVTRVLTSKPFVLTLWFGLCLFPVIKSVIEGHDHIHNNYFVYKGNFLHVISQQNLYASYPKEYFDYNHYGPIFSFIIAPFAMLPDWLGVLLWVVFTALLLLKSIQQLPISEKHYLLVILLCAHELMTSTANVQINPLVAALIIFTFVFIRNGKDFWAGLTIALGIFIKLYGVVGLAFFFFSKDKIKLIGSLLFWSVVLFVLPMLISSPSFIVKTYHDWYIDLVAKNAENETSTRVDVSVMGMIRKIAVPHLSNIVVLIPGVILFGLSYLRIKAFKNLNYQLLILASTLIFPVIFSTGSESPTYIIAFVGVAIWFINAERPLTWLDISLLVFALILTSLSPSDLFPRFIKKNYVEPYALKALPCFLIWLKIIYETLFRKFTQKDLNLPTATV
ncbi:glycosyltransferase family 87 protein [Mucilaginibacter auburnensis]|uniref:Uncharacterized protein DUF2029 n=1 Tax=Mucilaginibacter auburnensis TaxID=1457233 RepID=A0A2H9VM42_9SPHI|nr:glycosyltransferase family 87 protein [Mucilaginibacter auburnensis]PJJ79407.1 uncharacterized protein DUF2029 [Mucilaginibacter auburnensis]